MKKEEALQLMLHKARTAQDPTAAECWIITAKTLGASYDVDLVGYQIQCDKKNAVAAAETLQQMYIEFSSEPRFWDEITKLIESVKRDSAEEQMIFYKFFQQLLPAMQQTLLLEMAEKQKDKVEQCRYLLLLFRLFPESVGQFGVQLITVLSDLEKSLPNVCPHENIYSQLLVYEITPILLKSKELNLEENKCIQLLRQAIQFYISLAASGPPLKKHSITVTKTPRTPKTLDSKDTLLEMDLDNRPNDPWDSLLQCCQLVAQTCNWEVAKKLKNFKMETAKIVIKNAMELNPKSNEAFYTALIVFMFLAYKHSSTGASMPSVQSVIVVVPPDPKEQDLLSTEQSASPSSAKRAKLSSASSISDGVLSSNSVVTETYAVSAQCSQMIKSNSALVNTLLPADKYPWISQFLRDSLLCCGNYKIILDDLENASTTETTDLAKLLQLTSCKLLTQNYDESLRFAVNTIKNSTLNVVKTAQFASTNWHFATLNFTQTTHFACKVILHCLMNVFTEDSPDALIGHLLVLSQLDYPKLSWLSRSLLAIISKKQKFFYPKLLNYITVPTLLEEIAYLNAYENNLVLEIVETETVRKTGHSTRHSTRGAKGDIRAFLENQMTTGSRQSVEEVLKRYVIENDELILNFNAG